MTPMAGLAGMVYWVKGAWSSDLGGEHGGLSSDTSPKGHTLVTAFFLATVDILNGINTRQGYKN